MSQIMARKTILVKAIFAAWLLLVFAAQAYGLTFEDVGCSAVEGGTLCPKDPLITADLVFTSEITCLSSNTTGCTGADCADIIDIGCYSTMKPAKPITFQVCSDLVQSNGTTYDYSCSDQVVTNEYDAIIVPDAIDFTQCTKTLDAAVDADDVSLYVIQCPKVTGKTVSYFGSFVNETFFVAEYTATEGFDAAAFFSQNAAYIILVIALAAVLAWFFRPGSEARTEKVFSREKREEAPKRKRRERYAR